jgi:hypothetical protein
MIHEELSPKVAASFTDTYVTQMLGYLNIQGWIWPCCLILRTRDWNGNASCAREKLANMTHLIFMLEPDPRYPRLPAVASAKAGNPRHGEQAMVCSRLRANRRLSRAEGAAQVKEG